MSLASTIRSVAVSIRKMASDDDSNNSRYWLSLSRSACSARSMASPVRRAVQKLMATIKAQHANAVSECSSAGFRDAAVRVCTQSSTKMKNSMVGRNARISIPRVESPLHPPSVGSARTARLISPAPSSTKARAVGRDMGMVVPPDNSGTP